MKKWLALVLVLTLILGLAACGGATSNEAKQRESATAGNSANEAAIMETENMAPELCQILSEFRQVNGRDLTVDDVFADYRDNTHLFDGLYQVEDDGWLTIDGVRVLPVECRVGSSLSPQSLLQAYQSGAWDGLPVWTADYGTQAYVANNGYLYYVYDNPAASSVSDCPMWAYMDYAEKPLWETDEFASSSYGGDLYTHNASNATLVLECLVDLPDGEMGGAPDGEVCEQYWLAQDGLWLLMTTGLYHYQRGQRIAAWLCEVDDYDCFTTVADASYSRLQHEYLYTGDYLLSLEDDGQTEVIVENTVVPYTDEDANTVGAYYLEGDTLKLYLDMDGRAEVIVVVPAGVVDVTGFAAPYIQLDDGLTYCILEWNSDHTAQLTPLGPKTPAEYRSAWRECDPLLSFEDFVRDCQEQWHNSET